MTQYNRCKLIDYWRDLSYYDIKTAGFMFTTKRYPYSLFMCHLSIEKVLKAIIIKITEKQAPHSHNLVDLAKQTKIDFPDSHKDLLADLTEFNLEARYPEWQKEFYKKLLKIIL